MATGYEKINAIKSKLKVKQTVNSLAYLMGCGPRTIFRHLEVINAECHIAVSSAHHHVLGGVEHCA